jgi:hypothetical protein
MRRKPGGMVCLCLAGSWAFAAFGAQQGIPDSQPANAPNPQAVTETMSGKRTMANVAWWGFDPADSTPFLQAAIDSGAKTVVVPYVGAEWIVRPIKLRSNLELVFEPGVVVLAKKDEFKGKGDSLFLARDASDITLRGHGAALRMHKKDYQNPPYEKAEWRSVLCFDGCRKVHVEGLRLESSGGDGIYLGAGKLPYCADVVIRDVVCHDNHRQGISVIGAENLLIENCVLSNTGGTAPQAGIDFEPNGPREKLVNCVMRNCTMEGNAGAGVLIYLKQLSAKTDPVSIRVESCYIRSGKDVGIGVGAVGDDGPGGVIEFLNCTIENTAKGGIFVYDKSADKARVRFVNCKWKAVGMAQGETGRKDLRLRTPLLLSHQRPKITKKNGGIDFIDCYVYDEVDRPVLVGEDGGGKMGLHDVHGQIRVRGPDGARTDIRCKSFNVDVSVVRAAP